MSLFPAPNSDSAFRSFFSSKARDKFLSNAQELIRQGFSQNKFAIRLKTDFTDVLLLSPRYLPQLRTEDRLQGGPYTVQELLGYLPGFEPFRFADQMPKFIPDVILTRMNRYLSNVPASITEEVEVNLAENWTDEKVAVVTAVQALRKWPRALVSIVHWFHPKAKAARALLNEARAMIQPMHEQRKRDMAAGKPVPADTLTWFEEVAKGQAYDAAVVQLTMALAGLHSSTDLLCAVMLNLSEHPDVVEPLRQELVQVLKREGWKQTTFSQLTLMDSVLKESQRLKPVGRAFFKRVAVDNIKLDHGVEIPKGAFVAVSNHGMWDPHNYTDPDKFDAYRFARMSDNKSSAFSTVSVEHTGFGFGKNSCPGRNYVALQLKIILAHLLLKYEWKLPDNYTPATFNNGFDLIADPFAQVLVRRRLEAPEVSLRQNT
ncbi:Cytochrome PaP450-5 [Diaporthe amygdali]|uniref:Cytochrome PaP450-5 n=1 Tax=Phomopsis amygdali TaxID=1214568 RepID=UPI0022FF1724|nr:Cytochrome PaP450-5 [Diaporthe amygdali]KAJ0121347.1 Cytochrome PaP450-5 [Diaporthe amygdali]